MSNISGQVETSCPIEMRGRYSSSLGIVLAVPEWEAAITATVLSLIILLTVVGNVLVILSVFTYKPLRIVQNFFIVSLAVADLTVALLVLPFNVAVSILGRWEFGIHLCKMWLTCDVMCCTSSILNLCAIALDRYWAITDPIDYAQKRTLERVLLMIAGVWGLSLIISSPPVLGWNDWPDEFTADTLCELTQQQGYVIYSSLGSFYIPLIIMTIVYIEIYIATKRRLRKRTRAAKLNTMATRARAQTPPQDRDSVSSETNHNEHPEKSDGAKTEKTKKKKHKKRMQESAVRSDSLTEHQEQSSCSPVQGVSGNPVPAQISGEEPVLINTPAPSKKPPAVYQFIEEKQRISLSKERRAARTLGIIMGVFVVCWLPFFLMYVILPFCPTCCTTKKLINFITWLGYINSALNPIIYTIFNLEYRRAFKKLLGIK